MNYHAVPTNIRAVDGFRDPSLALATRPQKAQRQGHPGWNEMKQLAAPPHPRSPHASIPGRSSGSPSDTRGWEPYAGKPHVRLCVQRRLACSAGERPAGARVRSPVVWIAGWRETKTLKPIDNVSLGKTTSHRAVTTVNAKLASKVGSPEGRALNRRAKAACGSRNLTDAAPSLRRGGSDSTVARTCRATGEALLVPARNRRSRVDRITGSIGKSIEGERVTDGFVVALRRGNARGAKEPCCL